MSNTLTQFSATGLVAAGTSQGAALALDQYNQFHQVATCTSTNNGAVLPTIPKRFPSVYYVRNDGAYALAIYPPTGGAIDGRAVNLPAFLGSNAIIELVATTALQYYTVNRVGPKPMRPVTAAVTLTQYDHGCIFNIDQTAGPYTITLPSPVGLGGTEYEFRVAVSSAHVVTIASTTTNVNGGLNEMVAAATASGPASAVTNCVIGNSSPLTTVIKYYSDNVSWVCLAFCGTTGKITFT